MADAINAKTEQIIANLPNEAATHKSPKGREAAARCLASIQELPEAGRLWKSFMSEHLTEQELDVALTFFLSPAGGKFMGTKSVADGVVSTSFSKYVNEHMRPALARFEADL
jgi:hypothetical protein